MSVRSESYNQMNQSVQSALSSIGNAADAITKAKTAYDNSYWLQIQQKQEEVMYDYQKAIDYCNDIDEMNNIQQQYAQKLDSYLTEIKAPKSVVAKWDSQYRNSTELSMREYRENRIVPMMWNQAVSRWSDSKSGIITVIGSNGDLSYEEKRTELIKYWDQLGLADAPESITGHITTVDEALQMIEGACISQSVDRFYAQNNGVTGRDFSETDLANQIVSDLEKETGRTFDATTSASYKNVALQQIQFYEQKATKEAQKLQSDISIQYFDLVASGQNPGADWLMTQAINNGAFDENGNISKYWASWGVNNLMASLQAKNQCQALADYLNVGVEEIAEAAILDASSGSKSAGFQNAKDYLWNEDGSLKTLDDFMPKESSSDDKEPQGSASVFQSIFDENGIDYGNGAKTKTYSFSDGTSLTSSWGPRVDAILSNLGIDASNKDAVSLVISYVEAEGESGKYDSPVVTAFIEDLARLKYDPEITFSEYQNRVQAAINNGTITEDDLKSLGLWSPDTKNFLTSPNYQNISKDMSLTFQDALSNGELKSSLGWGRNYNKLDPQQQRVYNALYKSAMEYMERSFNRNPEKFTDMNSKEYKDKVEEAYKYANNKVLADEIKAAVSLMNNGFRAWFTGTNGSQQISVQEIASALYDQESDEHYLYSALIDEDAQAKLSIRIGEMWKGESLTDNDLAQEAYGKKYKELSSEQQFNVMIAKFRNEYARNLKYNIAEVFGVKTENMYQFYVDGVGPAYIDKSTGMFYMADRDPYTTNTFYTGSLSGAQLKQALSGDTTFSLSQLVYTTTGRKSK